MSVCAGCKVSHYCSRKCQVAAWKNGHKEWCPVLAAKINHYVDNLCCAKQFNWTGAIRGIYTKPFLDFRIAKLIATRTFLDFQWLDQQDVGGPNMEYFYKNMAQFIAETVGYSSIHPRWLTTVMPRKRNTPLHCLAIIISTLCFFILS